MVKIQFGCPKCGHRYETEEEKKNTRAKCISCSHIFFIFDGKNLQSFTEKPENTVIEKKENTISGIQQQEKNSFFSSFKQKAENHLGLFVAGLLISGFVSGVLAYNKTLDLFRYDIVTKDKLEIMEKEKQGVKEENKDIQEENRELREVVAGLRRELRISENEPITKKDKKILESAKKEEEENKNKLAEENRKKQYEKMMVEKKTKRIVWFVTVGFIAVCVLGFGAMVSGAILEGIGILLIGSLIVVVGSFFY